MEKVLRFSIIWFLAVMCLLVGLYFSFEHTFQMVRGFNFLYGPIGDQSVETARHFYPMITGRSSWEHMIRSYADHRVFTERLMMLYDFVFHNGVESIHPYRLSFVLWLNFFLFALVIFKIKTFPSYIKSILIGCAAGVLFAGYSITSYGSAMFMTWPWIMLFALGACWGSASYCDAIENNQWRKAKWYFVLINFLVVAMLATFNIGLIMWPIVFVILIKRKAWRPHWVAWLLTSGLIYKAFFWHWQPYSAGVGLNNILSNPRIDFIYYSRLVSIPIVSNADTTSSFATTILSFLFTLLVTLYLTKFLLKKKLTTMETIIFGYFLFSFVAILIITIMRAPIPDEFATIGMRFVTPTFMIFLCLWTSIFIFQYENNQEQDQTVVILLMLGITFWLVVLFMPQTGDPFDLSTGNEYFIALSTDVPISKLFIENTKEWNPDTSLGNLKYNIEVQKKYQKGIYSIWPSQYIKQTLPTTSPIQTCDGLERVDITRDLRKMHTPLVFMQLNYVDELINPYSYILFTDKNKKLIGYALPVTKINSLWQEVLHINSQTQIFRGVINTEYLHDKTVQLWAAKEDKTICKTGTILIR